MLYNYILENYKEAEPIFFSDLERDNISKSALNQQLKTIEEQVAKIVNEDGTINNFNPEE